MKSNEDKELRITYLITGIDIDRNNILIFTAINLQRI